MLPEYLKKKRYLASSFIILLTIFFNINVLSPDPLALFTIEDLLLNLNYPYETHKITTRDGYILSLHRIQAKNEGVIHSNKPVVFFQHGLIDSSISFVINDEDKAPALLFANKGYDVWLGNFRGNRYATEHVNLKVESE
jgi:hypothetical protein